MFNATFNNVSVVIVKRKVLRYQKWQKRTKGQTMIYKIVNRKLKIAEHKPN